MEKNKIILDTDIGTDVDDAFALGLILRSPELDLLGVTIVTDKLEERAQIALRELEAEGRLDIPVALGARQPLLSGYRGFPWFGHEGKGVLEHYPDRLPVSSEPAHVLISRLARENPGEITLVTIAPLTNIAMALAHDPELPANLKEIVIMGGNGRFGPESWNTPVNEHNTGSDPEATRMVLQCAAPRTMIGLDVTFQVQVYRENVRDLRTRGGQLGELLANQLEVYLEFIKRGSTLMHDPLTVAYLLDRTLCETIPMRVNMELRGEFTRGMTVMHPAPKEQSNAEVAVRVDAPRFEKLLLDRLLGKPFPSRPQA